MDFNLTEERRMLQEMLQRYLSENYDHETRRAILARGEAFDKVVLKGLADLGVLGALFSADYGGFGGSGFDISVVFEELGRAGTIEPILGSAVLAGCLIAAQAPGERADLLAEVMAGETILAFAHGETDARYELSHVATRAETAGRDILVNGVKTHVLHGAQAQGFIVSAREEGTARAPAGISLFWVPADTEGVEVTPQTAIDGTGLARVSFANVALPETARLGAACLAFPAIERAFACATLAVCAEALGAMEAAKALTLDYLRERKQFGVPIGSFQALQHRMADVLIEIEQARSAVINLAGHLDAPQQQRERFVSAAKNLIGRVGALVSEECIQMHGGIGMTDEYALSHYARRLVMIDHLFGDSDHHLQRFIELSAA